MILEQFVIPLSTIRPADILLLLIFGILIETFTWLIKYTIERKCSIEMQLREEIQKIKFNIADSRRLGPSAFVETSKLERALLVKEKKFNEFGIKRGESVKVFESRKKKFGLMMNAVVFLVYYGIPMFVIDGMAVEGGSLEEDLEQKAISFYRGLMFPISVFGMGFKLSSFGMKLKGSSLGALVIMWCGQATVNKITACLDALLL